MLCEKITSNLQAFQEHDSYYKNDRAHAHFKKMDTARICKEK